MFATHEEAKKAKWFSRRHQTSEENRTAREAYQAKRGGHHADQDTAPSTEEQYAKLDHRLGKGVGARKERRKLLLLQGWTQQMVDLEFPEIQK